MVNFCLVPTWSLPYIWNPVYSNTQCWLVRYNHAAKTHKWAFQTKLSYHNGLHVQYLSALQRGDPVVSVLKDRSDGEGGVRISGGVAVHRERLEFRHGKGAGDKVELMCEETIIQSPSNPLVGCVNP